MSVGVGTLTVTYAGYEVRGLPKLAVRAGQALERWGARAGRPVSRDEQQRRHEAQQQAQAAFESRQNGCFGIGTVLR
jgi:hypothetical protein